VSDILDKLSDYSVSQDVLTAHLEGEAVLLHLKTKQYFRLNETAAAIWQGLERNLDAAAIVASLVQDFDVDTDTAHSALARTLEDLKNLELIEW
jgi:hypothetical protein